MHKEFLLPVFTKFYVNRSEEILSKRNSIIDNLRGICMLGVIAIHAGSFVMESATASIELYLLFEVLSRYSVPAFFFISGYGLFLTYPQDNPLHYGHYLAKRLRSIGLPYVVWSCLYLLWYNSIYPSEMTVGDFAFTLFFGTACYHIYFLVILLWFYISFPLWRKLMQWLHKISLPLSLSLLFLLQLFINYKSMRFWSYPAWIANSDILLNFCNYRLNYLPLHYLFVFMLGGLFALHHQWVTEFLQKQYRWVTAFFVVAAGIMIGRFYQLFYWEQKTLENVTNNLQQLSPEGFVYTIACLGFFCATLLRLEKASPLVKLLGLFSANSYLIYLIHPFIMDNLYTQLGNAGIAFNTVPILVYYLAIVLCSLGVALILKKLGQYVPFLSLFLTGKK